MFDQVHKDSNSPISKIDHQKVCLTKIYGLLAKGSQFQENFPSAETFQSFFDGLVSHATNIFTNRKSFYDKDSKEVLTQLETMLKTVPELDPDETSAFVTTVKSIEKSLVTECQKANAIISAIEEDMHVFTCQADDISSIFVDTQLDLSSVFL